LTCTDNEAYKSRMAIRAIKRLLLISALLAVCSGVALGKGWRGIVPLHSTRSDVEKLLGPVPGWNYFLENETLHFEYQTPETECGQKSALWNVPLDTVLAILVVPKERKSIAEYGIDSTFVKSHTDLLNMFNYSNEDEGVEYSATRDIVDRIIYLPARKDWILACPGKVIKSRRV
jgi:hypothetical protein